MAHLTNKITAGQSLIEDCRQIVQIPKGGFRLPITTRSGTIDVYFENLWRITNIFAELTCKVQRDEQTIKILLDCYNAFYSLKQKANSHCQSLLTGKVQPSNNHEEDDQSTDSEEDQSIVSLEEDQRFIEMLQVQVYGDGIDEGDVDLIRTSLKNYKF